MFEFVRKHTRILQFILVLLILPSFVVFGIQGYDNFMDDTGVVAKVGRQEITQAELDNAHRNVVDRIRSQQPDADPSTFDTPEFRQRTLDMLLRERTLGAAARDQRLFVPDARLTRVFATSPEFAPFRNANGTLNTQLLESQGVVPAQFAERLRNDLALGQVLSGVESTGLTSKTSNRLAVEALFQVRDVQWMMFSAKDHAARLNPTPEQLRAFFEEPAMKAAFQLPERADVQYVVLDLEALKQRVTVSEEDLRKSYEQNQARYTQPEERLASHILIKAEKSAPAGERQAARARAEKVLAEVRANPGAFAELARKNSEDPGSATEGGNLDYFGRGAMTKPFEDAVFGMKKGEISGLVESDYGFHIIQLNDIRGGQVQPFEAVRAQIEDDARRQLAQRNYAEAAEKFTNLVYEQSDSLQPVADELKLTVQTASQIQRRPGGKDQGPVLGSAKLLAALFDPATRSKGRNTEAVEVAPSVLASARVVKYYPQAKPALAQVEAQVRERWIAREAVKAARQEAQQKLEAWKKAPDTAQLPAAVQMSRRLVFNQPPAVLDAALRVPENSLPGWTLADLGDEGTALIKVNKVLPLQISKEEQQATEGQFATYWAKAEADAYLRALKREHKAEVVTAPAAKKSEEDDEGPGQP